MRGHITITKRHGQKRPSFTFVIEFEQWEWDLLDVSRLPKEIDKENHWYMRIDHNSHNLHLEVTADYIPNATPDNYKNILTKFSEYYNILEQHVIQALNDKGWSYHLELEPSDEYKKAAAAAKFILSIKDEEDKKQ